MEGVTFQESPLAKRLRNGFVEARLHMDAPNHPDIDPKKFAVHQRLQAELIGSIALPHYAIMDPETGEFLARHHLHGGPGSGWVRDFERLFDQVLER